MTKKRIYPIEFKQESASLVLDQNYTIAEACKATGVGYTAMNRWVKQLRMERNGQTPVNGKALTAEHREIQELRARIARLEREKSILKKASALLMSDALSL